MADYFPVLSRAVAGLENNTADARRAVYERARAAIARQLQAIQPPLSEEAIDREQTQLEEAIRRIEAKAASPAPAPSAPARRPDPQPAPASEASRAAAKPGAPTPSARPETARVPPPRPAAPKPESGGPASDRPQPGKAGAATSEAAKSRPPEQRPAARADGRPIISSGERPKARDGSKRSAPMIAIGVLALVAIGAGLFAARGHLSGLFGGGAAPQEQQTAARTDAETTSTEQKASERLPQDAPADQSAPAPQQNQEVARAPEPTTPQPSDAQPAQPAAPAVPQEQPSQSGPLVAQRAVLYEEGPNQQSGEASQGTVTWRTESVSGGPDQPLETALRGDIDIPGRKLRATLTIRRNADATLPASHTIEIQFTLPEDFPNAGISNVPGVLMKADEAARGAAVSGLSVRVTSGFFLIGLSNVESERSVNEQLLRDRGWIDIPILYDNGRRAVLTLEKGTPGSQAFQEAFSAWRSASTQTPAAGNP